MTLTELLLLNLLLSLSVMLLLWFISLIKQDVSIVDPYWGFGFVLLSWFSIWMTEAIDAPLNSRAWLIVALVTIWGFRLSAYLLWRSWGHEEDRRYQKMRRKHGVKFWWVSFVTVFLLQGVLLWFIAWPVLVSFQQINIAADLRMSDAAGIGLWCIGLLFESVGDYQMARFKSDPKNQGQVLDKGLWRYTRHPNYFGDFCVWWGLFLLALPTGAWWTVLSPVLMSVLLMKISGVTLTESDLAERRPEYKRYQARTNAFFPWFPQKES